MRSVLAGPGARRALAPGRRGTVEIAFGTGGYLRFGDDFVLLAPVRSPAGPLSVLVAGLHGIEPGAPAAVDGDVLAVGDARVWLAAARSVRGLRLVAAAPGGRRAMAAALASVAPPAASCAAGLDALARGDLHAGVRLLAGRGDGLTPAGDDVLAGYAAWRWAQGRPAAVDGAGCSPLGRAYLRCAERGELPAPAAGVAEAVLAGDARAAGRRAAGLRCWGSSSGAALLWGMAAAGAGGPGIGA